MASFADIRPVLKSCGTWTFLKRVYNQISEDGLYVWASALAYSWLFSVFPFLILLLSLVPYLPKNTKDSAQQVVTKAISQTLGKEAPTINDNIKILTHETRTAWLWIGLCVTLWVASGGMAMTMAALDRCYEVKKSRPYLKQRALAMAITIGVTIFVLLIIVLLPIGEAVGSWAQSNGVISFPARMAFDGARYALSLFIAMAVLAIIYHFGPNIRQRFRLFSPGAVFSAIVWIVLNLVFRFYIDKYARYDQTYGTVGGAAILLFFFYIDGLVLLIGAEINSEIDFQRLGLPGSCTDPRAPDKDGQKLPEIAKEL
jgi:membrane protein